MPDAADVHALTGALDDIVDYAEEAADALGRYGVEAHDAARPGDRRRARRARPSEVAAALRGLRDGSDAGPHLVEIHRLENEADRIVREAVASLFADGIDPMVVIRWQEIFESLEAAVDACETAANVLEGIAIKRPVAASPCSHRARPGAAPAPSHQRGASHLTRWRPAGSRPPRGRRVALDSRAAVRHRPVIAHVMPSSAWSVRRAGRVAVEVDEQRPPSGLKHTPASSRPAEHVDRERERLARAA